MKSSRPTFPDFFTHRRSPCRDGRACKAKFLILALGNEFSLRILRKVPPRLRPAEAQRVLLPARFEVACLWAGLSSLD